MIEKKGILLFLRIVKFNGCFLHVCCNIEYNKTVVLLFVLP